MPVAAHRFLMSAVAAIVCVLTSTSQAADPAEVAKLYQEFNAPLQRARPPNFDALRSFYALAHRKSTDECDAAPLCRNSEHIFLDVITLTKYEIASIENSGDGSVNLSVSGSNASDVKMGLVVKLLFEEGKWRIDSIMKVPPNWDQLRRKLRGNAASPK